MGLNYKQCAKDSVVSYIKNKNNNYSENRKNLFLQQLNQAYNEDQVIDLTKMLYSFDLKAVYKNFLQKYGQSSEVKKAFFEVFDKSNISAYQIELKDLDSSVIADTLKIRRPLNEEVFNNEHINILNKALECLPEKNRAPTLLQYLKKYPKIYATITSKECLVNYIHKNFVHDKKLNGFADNLSQYLKEDLLSDTFQVAAFMINKEKVNSLLSTPQVPHSANSKLSKYIFDRLEQVLNLKSNAKDLQYDQVTISKKKSHYKDYLIVFDKLEKDEYFKDRCELIVREILKSFKPNFNITGVPQIVEGIKAHVEGFNLNIILKDTIEKDPVMKNIKKIKL